MHPVAGDVVLPLRALPNIYSPGEISIAQNTSINTLPDACCLLAFKCSQPPTYPTPIGDFMDSYSLNLVRQQCRANGLYGSLSMTAQQDASDWLKTMYDAADAAPVFMGFELFSFPYSEVSAIGNGTVYIAPTALGPVANLTTENGDFVPANEDPPIKCMTAARVDQPNVLQMQCVNRTSNYNPSVVEQPDAASISLFGVRKQDPIINNAVQDVSIARQLLGIQVRKLQYGGDVYSFTLPAKWVLLAPMDLITITDPLMSLAALPVRLTSVSEQDSGELECEAEPFVYGMYAPTVFNADTPTPYQPNPGVDVNPINAPVIFKPVPALISIANQGQVWAVVSDSDPNYGGAQGYISTDGGSSYQIAGDPIVGNGITGHNTSDWPAHSSPDTTNDLPLDLTESLGVLQSFAVADEDNFLYPCYIAGGGASAIPYELMTYAVATMTAANKYTLKATGGGTNHLDRAVHNAPAPAGAGVDHPISSRWAFLPPNGQGILKLPLQPAWIGTTIHLKFVPFNTFGVASGDLSTATAYAYTVLGTSGAGPNLFLVNGA
jgi:Putative phage tail protein